MSESDHAQVLAPAPVFYVLSLVVGFVIHSIWPVALGPKYALVIIGLTLILLSVPTVLFALKAMKRENTAFDARKSTSAVVKDGPFRFTRNPTYFSLTLLTVGLSLALNSAWLLVGSVVATTITHFLVINPEERYLTAKFGEEYSAYARRVRRWI